MKKLFFVFLLLISFNICSAEVSYSEWKKFDELKHNTIDYWLKRGFEIKDILDGSYILTDRIMGIIICRVYYENGEPWSTQCYREVYE